MLVVIIVSQQCRSLYKAEENESKDHERLERSNVDVNVVLLLQQVDNRRLMTQALQH